jgi:hypothetical protein
MGTLAWKGAKGGVGTCAVRSSSRTQRASGVGGSAVTAVSVPLASTWTKRSNGGAVPSPLAVTHPRSASRRLANSSAGKVAL